ncbi:MAG: hypothetical protein N3G21_01265 [Candidatus Hydrogenedentes bacterium]|nr:hypothetical protein [Candidatus Hydrogenedentota bacterium]
MKKKLMLLSLGLIILSLLGGMKGCSVIGVTPSTLTFTSQDVQNGNSLKFEVWSKVPLLKVRVSLECDDEWVDVNPVGFDTMGSWNKVPVTVKINPSVLESADQILESVIKISGEALRGRKVTASSNVTVKVNLGGNDQTGGSN